MKKILLPLQHMIRADLFSGSFIDLLMLAKENIDPVTRVHFMGYRSVAEEVGFEPTKGVTPWHISSVLQ
jgi:hypothetical protein